MSDAYVRRLEDALREIAKIEESFAEIRNRPPRDTARIAREALR
jgi:hypothetical protein